MRLALLLFPLLLCQCSLWRDPEPVAEAPQPVYRVHQERYAALRPGKASIRVDLGAQTAKLLNEDGETVILTDISSGKGGHQTPHGIFRISEMKVDKRSTIYGRYHDSHTGEDLGESAGFTKPPKRGVYEGYEMPYWMRLTDDGVGMHVGYVVPRTPVSFGCIRVPQGVQPLIFEKCRIGTKVEVTAPDPVVPEPNT